MQDDEPLFGGRPDNVLPKRSGLDAGASRAGVDVYTAQTRRLHEDRVIEHGKRGSSMARSLWRDPKAMFARKLDDVDNVLDGLDQCNRARPLIDCKVPCLASAIPLGVAWKHE